MKALASTEDGSKPYNDYIKNAQRTIGEVLDDYTSCKYVAENCTDSCWYRVLRDSPLPCIRHLVAIETYFFCSARPSNICWSCCPFWHRDTILSVHL